MRFRIRLPLPWTLIATLFAVAISSAGGKTGTTAATTPTTTTTTTTTKSGTTTSTPSREDNLLRMDELRNSSEHLRGQLHVKQGRLNGAEDLAKKREKAHDYWRNATKEVELSEERKNLSQIAKDDPTASKSNQHAEWQIDLDNWKTANETLLNATISLQESIQEYNSSNHSDISSITNDFLISEERRLKRNALDYGGQLSLIDSRGDKEKRAELQKQLNDTNAKLEILTELIRHFASYSRALNDQLLAGDATSLAEDRLREQVVLYKEDAALLIQRTHELKDAEKKAESAFTSLTKVEVELKERERLLEEIGHLTEKLSRAKQELIRLEEMTRTPPPPQAWKKTQGGKRIPIGALDRTAYDAYQEIYRNRPRDPDRPWRFLCKANGCDNDASDMLALFLGLGTVGSCLLLAQRVYYCWDEGTHCFERSQRDEDVEIGKSKKAKEEKPQRKLEDANCSAGLRERSTRAATTSAK